MLHPSCKAAHQLEQSKTSVVGNFLECGDFGHVLKHFQTMQDECSYLNTRIAQDLLKACSKLKDVEIGQFIHTLVIKRGFDRDSFVGCSLVDMYAKCNSLMEAQSVFDKLHWHDVVSWTSLIAGYSYHGFGEKALTSLRNMQSEGFFPNDITFVCSLKGCTAIGAIDKGKDLHSQTVVDGYVSDIYVGTTLVDMYAKFGLLPEAQDVFDELPLHNAVTWNALTTGYAEHGCAKEVFTCLERMHMDFVYPDAGTFICGLRCCDSEGTLKYGQKLHMMAVYNGFDKDRTLSTALVDMYMKCGTIMEAKEAFDQLAAKDVMAWNALISMYSEEGLQQEVLECLRQMICESVYPDDITWVSVLKACSFLGEMEKGHEKHTMIVKGGYENYHFVSGSLVDMYAKCGAIAEAQKVLEEASWTNSGSWTSLITGCAEHGFDEEALTFLEKMQSEDIPLDRVALLCIVKVCSMIGCIEKGQDIHSEIAKEGFEEDLHIANTLVDMYAKCGLLEEAREVFEDLHSVNVVTCNALAAGYIQNGLLVETLDFLQGMPQGGIFSNSTTLMNALKACGGIRALAKGQEVHAEVISEGFETDTFLSSTVIDMYAKCGWLVEAQDVFDELGEQTLAAWNALISGYSEHGHAREAFLQLEKMQLAGFSPNIVTYIFILRVSSSMELCDNGQKVHCEATWKGLEFDPFLGSALVDMYAKCGEVLEAQSVFDKLTTQDVVSWTALIAGYATLGCEREALNCLQQMESNGHAPNTVTFICSLKACSGIGAITKGRALHSQVTKEELEKDLYLGTALIDMYAKCHLLLEAREVLDDLQLQEPALWTALITGYVEHGFDEEALNCFEEMQVKSLSPNHVTLVCILQACGNIGALNQGQEAHHQIAAEGLEYDAYISLVAMYVKCGALMEGKDVFDEASRHDSVSWNALMVGYAYQGACELVFECLEMMWRTNVQPNGVTFLSVLFACSHAGLVDIGLKYFKIIFKEYRIAPTIEHFNCVIDLVGRASQVNMALDLLAKMPIQPNIATWSTIMGACRKWGNPEVGRHAFENMVQLGDNKAAACALMTNIYVCANRWEDHREIELMRECTFQSSVKDSVKGV